jgi:hypothetical protein
VYLGIGLERAEESFGASPLLKELEGGAVANVVAFEEGSA